MIGRVEILAPADTAIVRLTLASGHTCGASRGRALLLPAATALIDQAAVVAFVDGGGAVRRRIEGWLVWRDGVARFVS